MIDGQAVPHRAAAHRAAAHRAAAHRAALHRAVWQEWTSAEVVASALLGENVASTPLRGYETIELRPGSMLSLHRPSAVWLVMRGTVDLYAELRAASGAVIGREYLLTVPSRQTVPSRGVLFAFPTVAGRVRILASGRRGTVLERFEGGCLEQPPATTGRRVAGLPPVEDLLEAADAWLLSLSAVLARGAEVIDFVEQVLQPGQRIHLERGQRIVGEKGGVWARFSQARVSFLETVDLDAGAEEIFVPLVPETWLKTRSQTVLQACGTADLAADGSWLPAMMGFHRLALDLLRRRLEDAYRDEQLRLATKATSQAGDRRAVLARFGAVFDRRPLGPDFATIASPLVAAIRRIGKVLGAPIEAPPEGVDAGTSVAAEIEEIARRSRLRTRQVVLRHRWWRQESGPMLAFRRDCGEPVVLLPARRGRVLLSARDEAEPRSVTAEVAADIDPVAFAFDRGLPDRRLGPIDLLRFAAAVCRRDLLAALACSALAALMAMLVPIATGLIIDVSIPTHQPRHLFSIALGLIVAAVAAFCFQIGANIAIVRAKGNVKRVLEPALLDRLLRMPSDFFRRYASGDLAQRTMTIALIQSQLTGGVLSTLLGGFVSLVNFLVMIYLQPVVAAVAMAVLALLAVGSIWAVYRQQADLASTQRLRGKLASRALQMVTGIRRIRLAGAEDRFFVRWGHLFMELREAFFAAYRVRVSFQAFLNGYQILAFAIVFGALAFVGGGTLTTGGFLAFLAAFTLAMTAFAGMARTLVDLADLAPMYARVRPLLESLPEDQDQRAHPGPLSGHIEVQELSFRYSIDMPMVLKGVTLRVEAGESVAIVGVSGSGKSTLLRLILGFEQPTAGGLYFDGKDLASLEPREVRRQIGVVLQRDKLMEATIFENIRGISEISMAGAWHAARMAGIEDDIQAMPLGMHTVISAEGSDLSGGQAQRLLIARALADRPRILLLDEATSALDNQAQATVIASLERLRVTRIVVAHRLSTVKGMDRIVVLDQGRVAESGSYDELMATDGLFAELVRRQLE